MDDSELDDADGPRRHRRYDAEAYQCNPKVFWVFALGMSLIILGGILNIVGEVTAAVAGVSCVYFLSFDASASTSLMQ